MQTVLKYTHTERVLLQVSCCLIPSLLQGGGIQMNLPDSVLYGGWQGPNRTKLPSEPLIGENPQLKYEPCVKGGFWCTKNQKLPHTKNNIHFIWQICCQQGNYEKCKIRKKPYAKKPQNKYKKNKHFEELKVLQTCRGRPWQNNSMERQVDHERLTRRFLVETGAKYTNKVTWA